MKTLTNKTILTQAKDEAAAFYFWRKDLNIAAITILVFVVILACFDATNQRDIVLIITNFIWNIMVLAVLIGAIFLGMRKKTHRQLTASYAENKQYTIHYKFDEIVHIILGKDKVDLAPQDIRYVIEQETCYYLRNKRNQTYLIDKDGFKEDISEFETYLNERQIKLKRPQHR